MKSLISRIQELDLSYQIQLLGTCVLAVWFALYWMPGANENFKDFLLLLAFTHFGIGFTLWCWPRIIKTWGNFFGKAIITVAHLFILLVATVFARNLVASALGLPPQDFDLTVSFWTLILYIPAWAFATSIALGVIAIVFQTVGILRNFFGSADLELFKMFLLMAGALYLSFSIGTVFNFAQENKEVFYPMVRWIAYASDFQQAPLYPGIKPNERIRLHENGVISVAHQQDDGSIAIDIRKFE